ncbi:hypothetical protein DFR64_2028 [Pelolinea submarina]|uniref:Uncharacterized protein n=1 Tax=Pelolinea submarina TaxID=913107 RepID=A0A3E0AB18_9CHLR|nr:hypothetical protein DFR64_2028 [Pelolinea submarina]
MPELSLRGVFHAKQETQRSNLSSLLARTAKFSVRNWYLGRDPSSERMLRDRSPPYAAPRFALGKRAGQALPQDDNSNFLLLRKYSAR